MTLDRFPLIVAPTPLHRLDRASEALGMDLWIKRDDLTGFALGGNKGRKLEYLIADWLGKGVYAVVTCGASDSNFIRQLAVACAMAGIECHAAVMDLPFDSGAGKPAFAGAKSGGNERLSLAAGARLTKFDDDDWEVLYEHMNRIGESVGAEVVPVGGSSARGAYAFWRAAEEVRAGEFDQIIFASSSGSTQVGLATAFRGTSTRILGVACDPEPEIVHDFANLSEELAGLLQASPLLAEDFELDLGFVGPGYGVPSEAGSAAQSFLLKTEGIYLDSIYTAKAFSCLMSRRPSGKTLFWHTGGMPSLFTDYGP